MKWFKIEKEILRKKAHIDSNIHKQTKDREVATDSILKLWRIGAPHIGITEGSCPICKRKIDLIDLLTERINDKTIDFGSLDIEKLRNEIEIILVEYNKSGIVPTKCPMGHNLNYNIIDDVFIVRQNVMEYDKYLDILVNNNYKASIWAD